MSIMIVVLGLAVLLPHVPGLAELSLYIDFELIWPWVNMIFAALWVAFAVPLGIKFGFGLLKRFSTPSVALLAHNISNQTDLVIIARSVEKWSICVNISCVNISLSHLQSLY